MPCRWLFLYFSFTASRKVSISSTSTATAAAEDSALPTSCAAPFLNGINSHLSRFPAFYFAEIENEDCVSCYSVRVLDLQQEMTQEAAEAEATLQAVLSFLDECELDQAVDLVGQQQQVDALVATQGERPSQKRCAPKRPRGYKANRARDERRFELIHLRETVSSLEKELDDLFSQARKRQSAPKPPRSDEPSSALLVTSSIECAFSMWEGIASRQLDQRQRAEMENIRLKNFLEQQIKVAKTLQRLIHRRAAWEVRPCGGSVPMLVLTKLFRRYSRAIGGRESPGRPSQATQPSSRT